MIDIEYLTAVIRSVTDLWDEPLDEVHDIPQIAQAIIAARFVHTHCACGCPDDMHVGEIGCPCGLPDEMPCSPTSPDTESETEA